MNDISQQQSPTTKSRGTRSAILAIAFMIVSGGLFLFGIVSLLHPNLKQTEFEVLIESILTLGGLVGIGFSLFYSVRGLTDVDADTLSRIEDRRQEERLVADLDARINEKKASAFCYYFIEMRNILENKAIGAGKKASIQLGYGVWVAGLGVFVYATSIFVIQNYFRHLPATGDSTVTGSFLFHHAWATTTGLFLFVEFLSAWFLKQYRYFQDTAIYLLNLKSVLDKHLLTFLAIQDLTDERTRSLEIATLLESLHDPLQWPVTSALTRQDVGFAKEVMESITDLLKASRKKTGEKETQHEEGSK
jgi:hypothetical protein